MAQRGLGLLRQARLTRKQLIGFALLSAAFNGLITASVGAWLGQTYAKYQNRQKSIDSLTQLAYERRARAGMVTSAIRRGAELDEIRFRKRAYDEAFVDWNAKVMQSTFIIREVTGDYMSSSLEKHFEDSLVAALADIDRCVTKAYDARIAEQDAKAILDQCQMTKLHQSSLDCISTFTNELYKLSKLNFLPFMRDPKEGNAVAERRIAADCKAPEAPPVAPSAAKEATPPVAVAPAVETPPTATPTPPPPVSP